MFLEEERIKKKEDELKEQQYIEIFKTLKKDLVITNINNINLQTIAIIDTKTNYIDNAISVGVAIVNTNNWQLQQAQYYLISPELINNHQYDNLNIAHVYKSYFGQLSDVENHIRKLLSDYNVTNIYAYNATFVFQSLPGLQLYFWYDIMKIAAYKQYNKYLPQNIEYLENGRIKYGYGIKNIMEYLTQTYFFYTNHALYDVLDEIRIMKMLELNIEEYNQAKIN
jgi:hypothetical protein